MVIVMKDLGTRYLSVEILLISVVLTIFANEILNIDCLKHVLRQCVLCLHNMLCWVERLNKIKRVYISGSAVYSYPNAIYVSAVGSASLYIIWPTDRVWLKWFESGRPVPHSLYLLLYNAATNFYTKTASDCHDDHSRFLIIKSSAALKESISKYG